MECMSAAPTAPHTAATPSVGVMPLALQNGLKSSRTGWRSTGRAGSGCCCAWSISSAVYMPWNVSGNARRHAAALAHFSIITPGILAQLLLPVL